MIKKYNLRLFEIPQPLLLQRKSNFFGHTQIIMYCFICLGRHHLFHLCRASTVNQASCIVYTHTASRRRLILINDSCGTNGRRRQARLKDRERLQSRRRDWQHSWTMSCAWVQHWELFEEELVLKTVGVQAPVPPAPPTPAPWALTTLCPAAHFGQFCSWVVWVARNECLLEWANVPCSFLHFSAAVVCVCKTHQQDQREQILPLMVAGLAVRFY